MRCLTLTKGFFPAIKTWKRFTIKVLQKLHPGKFIKITKTHYRAKTTKYKAQPPPMYYPSLPSNEKRRRFITKNRVKKPSLYLPKHSDKLKKQSLQALPPVFIDELFWNQARDVEEGLHGSSVLGGAKGDSSAVVGTQLRGIDARAEEFITRFRADLENQETVAHLL